MLRIINRTQAHILKMTCILFELSPSTQNNTGKYKKCNNKIIKQNKEENPEGN